MAMATVTDTEVVMVALCTVTHIIPRMPKSQREEIRIQTRHKPSYLWCHSSLLRITTQNM